MKSNTIIKGIITGVVIVIVLNLAYSNKNLIEEPIQKYFAKEYNFEEAKDAITTTYVENLKQKYWFINLNGLFVRLTGGRVCNDIVLLNNGMLTDANVASYDTTNNALMVEELSEQLKNKGIDLLYVQSPSKMDLNNDLLPLGLVNEGNNNANQLIEHLENNNVNVLDLRTDMADTPEHIKEYFYDTDHHWNPIGAFHAFQEISKYLQGMYPDEEINGYYQDIENWDIHRKEDWFLGSRGKRTGTYFAGVDDLIWLTPKFDTEMSFANIYRGDFYYGDYETANIREEYINEKDYFNRNAYCVYIGGDFPLTKHRNSYAPVDMKILIVKDSFVLPLESYFSTVFKEVDVIDLRHYTAGTLDEYILESNPDLVIMNFNTYGVSSEVLYGTGADVSLESNKTTEKIGELEFLKIYSAPENNYNCQTLYNNIETGRKYTLKCETIEVAEGYTDAISMLLYDSETQTTYDCDMWDLRYSNKDGQYEWTFTAPSEGNNLELIVYSGICGKTSNIGIEMTGIELYKYTD